MNANDATDRVVQLEEIFTHQQQVIDELNQVLIQMREEHDRLCKKVETQQSQIEWLIDNLSEAPSNEKPPHY